MASDEYRPPWLPVNPVPEPAETSDNAPEAEPDPVVTAHSEAEPDPVVTADSEAEPDPVVTADSEAEPAPEAEAEREDPPTPIASEVAPAPAPESALPAAPLTAWPFTAAPTPAPTAAPTVAPSLTLTPTPAATDASFADPSAAVPPTGSSPSPAAAAAFFGVRGDRAAVRRETEAVEPEPTSDEPEPTSDEPEPTSDEPGSPAVRTPPRASEPPAEFSPAPAFVPPPAFEPWRTFEPAPPAPQDPPLAEPTTTPPPVIRSSPYLSGSLPVTDHGDEEPEERASAQDSWAPSRPSSPPVTGSFPAVRPDDLTLTKPQMPLSAHSAVTPQISPAAPEHTAAPEPEQTAEPEQLAEPETTADSIPTPIEADEDEIIAPILPPPDTEIMPRAGDDESTVGDAPASGTTPWSPTESSEGQSEKEFSPAPTDSVRQLGASAISNASLQAAGAPTPISGVPRVPEHENEFPSFGDEEPFVPRFEPSVSTMPTPTPTVSFAEPAPRVPSPLDELDVPETDEPAYTPRVELNSWPSDEPGPKRESATRDAPVVQNAAAFAPPLEGAPALPARPWSAFDDDDVEFAATTIEPRSGLPAEMVAEMEAERESDALVHSTDPKDSTVNEPAEPRLPIVPRRAVTDSASGEETPSDAPATESDLESENNAESTTGDQDVAATAPRNRRRWVWWLIIALLVASAAGVLIYRMFLLPEPITLPVPTVTASPATPLGSPLAIAEPTDFVAALPDTVGTDVLMAYESIDPLTEPDLPARLAEHDRLSYGTGTGAPDFVVNAYQHYTTDDAQKAYDSWAADATDVEPVLVDGEQVGDRALMTQGTEGTVVWRNVTAVFVLTGPAESVLDFYEHYGV